MPARKPETQLQGITDLCLLTAIKPGFVTAFETISHVERLRRVLKTLNGLRLAARESSPKPGLFTDVVSRFRIVHSFRWAIIEPRPGIDAEGTPHKFLLNVCFDGGWEPYMRVIWDELGSMLDLMLCHCEGYALARETSFERYMAWVRANEFSADFLYLASGRSCSDHEYLAALELLQRQYPEAGPLGATRLRTPAQGSAKPLPSQPQARFDMAVRGLPALAALHGLERYFLAGGAPDGDCLLRASRDILFELVQLDTLQQFPLAPPANPAAEPLKAAGHQLRQVHGRMLSWFERVPALPMAQARELAYAAADIQGGMLSPYPDLSGGALVLLRVAQRAQAVAWLSAFQASSEADTLGGKKPAGGLYRNVALSLSGLKALGVPASRLARFPQPFVEGMEARAGLLGDLRSNHPRYWRLPQRNWPQATAAVVDLNSVHVLIQLRHGDKLAPAKLQAAIAQLEVGSGLQILSVQAMRRNSGAQGETRENFGFVDGISQPQVVEPPAATAPGAHWSDAVRRGELLLGFPTRRDRVAVPEQADALLDLGSFLVVRKLRQYVRRLHQVIDPPAQALKLRREDLLAKMMGRSLDGAPLAAPALGAGNDFNYSADAEGAQCPFHAHIRRANPREGQALPRLLRRGMSYGPAYVEGQEPEQEQDRGLVFMAYNANLAEQFETVQRWIAGGNASGGYSGQADPFLGVPEPGQPRIFRFEQQGQALHVDLKDQPFVELQWGAYFFVPAIKALRNLAALVELPLPEPLPAPLKAPPLHDRAAWQLWLEDANSRDAAWAYVRSQPGGVLRTDYGVLVGDAARVMEVFRDPAQRYSVGGYGERMQQSIGRGYLGMDEDSGHREQAPRINAAIEAISEAQAFEAAYPLARELLRQLRQGNLALRQPEALLDLERLSEQVLAELCKLWFGLPNGQQMWGCEWHAPQEGEAPRCPRDLFAVSRYVFGPRPTPVVEQVARGKGQGLLQAVRDWLATAPKLPTLSQAIVDALQALAEKDADIIPRTLAGIMLGFPPTVHGNLVSSLSAWVVSKKLWDLQQDWQPPAEASVAQRYSQAIAALRPTLIATMMGRPVPGMVWRTARSAHTLGQTEVLVGDRIIVGIASCTQQNPSDHYPMFGGDRRDAQSPAPLHACPGYAMAMGVMLGVSAAVLEAGALRFTGSPTVLALQLP